MVSSGLDKFKRATKNKRFMVAGIAAAAAGFARG
jgi:hypothetical protein